MRMKSKASYYCPTPGIINRDGYSPLEKDLHHPDTPPNTAKRGVKVNKSSTSLLNLRRVLRASI